MDTEPAQHLAHAIAQAWHNGQQCQALPGDWQPTTLAEGYGVQALVVSKIGEPIAGWKIACTTPEMQSRYGVQGPYFGPLLQSATFSSGASLSHGKYLPLGLEAEFAFRLAKDIPVQSSPVDKIELAGAIESVLTAIEIVSLRLGPAIVLSGPLAISDLAGNGGVVLGEPFDNWQQLDLAEHSVSLAIDGEICGRGTGRAALGHPFDALAWLVEACHSRNIAPRAGQIVLTGSCTGIAFLPKPGQVVTDHGQLGRTSITFT
jgi:2-keto-4-pentenoate hydratase